MVTLATAGASPAKIRADPRGVAPPAHRHSRTLHDQLITSRCGSATWSCTLDSHSPREETPNKTAWDCKNNDFVA